MECVRRDNLVSGWQSFLAAFISALWRYPGPNGCIRHVFDPTGYHRVYTAGPNHSPRGRREMGLQRPTGAKTKKCRLRLRLHTVRSQFLSLAVFIHNWSKVLNSSIFPAFLDIYTVLGLRSTLN
ncbi:hypothetical protein GDO78_017200 [Eleutherodactylus coqui]|uniref:Uncharacterized protein n=1 Tax=Eleutherodactylus coqui TaxID=57060 RepID=A0A8J6BE00_ELECQ|nr:hypothetical protein GDO78_017200 [Eleutherodactylus coqui]